MHHPTYRISHTTAFVTPVVEHWLEREIAQWVHHMKDGSHDPSHHEQTLLPRIVGAGCWSETPGRPWYLLTFKERCTSRSLSPIVSIPATPCRGRSLETTTGSCCQVWSAYGSAVHGFSFETAPESEYQVTTFPSRACRTKTISATLSKMYYIIFVNSRHHLSRQPV